MQEAPAFMPASKDCHAVIAITLLIDSRLVVQS
jgi:hypothetical protein